MLRRFKGPKKSGGSLGCNLSSDENDRSEDRTDERQAPVSMASEVSAAKVDPKIHERGWGIGRVLRRFKELLMSGLDAEEDAEVDGTWRLSPMDLDQAAEGQGVETPLLHSDLHVRSSVEGNQYLYFVSRGGQGCR